MVTQNEDDWPNDLDYNIEIKKAKNINDCKSHKRKMLAVSAIFKAKLLVNLFRCFF